MRILILGGDGMLGHQLLNAWEDAHDVRVTLRGGESDYRQYGLFNLANSIYGIDVRNFGRIEGIVKAFRPEAIVNAVGIVKQRPEAHDAVVSLEVNAVFPHRLSLLCREAGVRLVQVSTDCVFSGSRGMYSEDDLEDARDLYGRSKLLGEVRDAHVVTLRTSMIGLELARKKSLVEWFLAKTGVVEGFRKALFSGFTTLELARIIEGTLVDHRALHGLWHVASNPIDKFTLLKMLQERLNDGRRVVVPENAFACDRSLLGQRFNRATGYQPPGWETMLEELVGRVGKRGN